MGLTKVSDGSIRLTGRQKAAILLCELGASPEGHDVVETIYEMLKLTPKQKNILTKEIKKLGPYDPDSYYMAKRENSVLEFLMDWGNLKGFDIPEPADFTKVVKSNVSPDYVENLKKNPDVVTSILKQWLSE